MNVPSITCSITVRCPSKCLYMDICQLPPRMGLLKKRGFKEEREKGRGGGGGSFESKRRRRRIRSSEIGCKKWNLWNRSGCNCAAAFLAEEFGRERSIWEEFNRQLSCIFARWLTVCLEVSRVGEGMGVDSGAPSLSLSLSLSTHHCLYCAFRTHCLWWYIRREILFFFF